MATWVPINGLAIQLAKNAGGAAAADYYLKFYDEGTTTPASMATDSTGGTTLDKCKLSSVGLAVNGSDDPFIPHIDRNYKIACYTNATDADNNATGSAFFVIDNIKLSSAINSLYTPEGTNASTISIATYLDTRVLDDVTALRAYEPVVDEEQVWIVGHTTEGIGGGAFYYDQTDSTTADNNGTVIVTTGGARWKRQYDDCVHVDWFGAIPDYDPSAKTGTNNYTAFSNAYSSGAAKVSFAGGGKYAVSQAITSSSPILTIGWGSQLYQTDILASLYDLNGMDGSEWHGGDYSHNMDIIDYNINNARLFEATVAVNNILLYQIAVFKTAQQGIDLDAGGDNFQAVLCDIQETARDGIFLLNCTRPKISLCTFTNTGDDAIAFAGQTTLALATSNTIKGAGSYNLGGSGIRSNRSGTISNNTIEDSDLFGIIAAVNSADATARPEQLTIANNVIKGINKTGTVTAGIGFKDINSVECIGNEIEMKSKEAHAYRLYGTTKSGTITIAGGETRNAKSMFYFRDEGAELVSINGTKNVNSDDHVLVEATGQIDKFELKGTLSKNTTNCGYFRCTASNSATILRLDSKSNRLITSNASPFIFNDKVVSRVFSEDDHFPTGSYADTQTIANTDKFIINGRHGEVTKNQGSITFNATNTGLIPIGLSVVPLGSEFTINLRSALGAATYWYLEFFDSVNFRIYLDAAPGANVTFDWSVEAFNNRDVA